MHLKPCRVFFLHESVIHVPCVDDCESNCTPSLANRVVTAMTITFVRISIKSKGDS